CLSPAARAKNLVDTLTYGSARKASLHPRLYGLARFAGSEPASANQSCITAAQQLRQVSPYWSTQFDLKHGPREYLPFLVPLATASNQHRSTRKNAHPK